MHYQRPARRPLPAADHGCARPRGRGFDMVGLPGVEYAMKRDLVVEIAVAAIDRKAGRRNRDQDGAGTALDHLMLLARRDQDHLVTEARGGAKFGLGIGTNAAAGGRIKS